MGNLNTQTWEELWHSEQAEIVRKKVRHCDRNCWMIGSVSPAMHKYIWKPTWWVLRHKFLRFWKPRRLKKLITLTLGMIGFAVTAH